MSDLFINFAMFNSIEHPITNEQKMSDQEILNRAVAALNSNLYREKATIDYDGDVPCLTLMGKRFWCVVKPNLTLVDMMDKCLHTDNKEARILYVTINATPKMLELAKTSGSQCIGLRRKFQYPVSAKKWECSAYAC